MIGARTLAPLLLCVAVGAQAQDKQRLELSGRIYLDIDQFDAAYSKNAEDNNVETELRLGRLQLDYDFPAGWVGKIQLETDGQDLELGNAYMRYTQWSIADITLGKMKEPVGLERNTNSADLWIIEGALISTAFTADKNWGVNLQQANKTNQWSVAVTTEYDNDDYDSHAPTALSGRYTRTLINNEQQALQIGASGSLRNWNDNVYQVRERPEVHGADNMIRSAEMVADQQQILGFEGLWLLGKLSFQAEYIASQVEELNNADWDYDGFYVMGSYFLGDYQRELKRGETRRVKPPAGGLWELVARYGELDVRQRNTGSTAAVSTLGVNYYINRDVRVMANAKYTDLAGSVRHDETDGYAMSVRVQFLF